MKSGEVKLKADAVLVTAPADAAAKTKVEKKLIAVVTSGIEAVEIN